MRPFHKLRRFVAAGFGLVLAVPEAAWPQQLAPRYDVPPAPAAITLGATGLAWMAAHAFKPQLPHATCAPCDPAGLWSLDRAVIGRERAPMGTASDLTLGATMAGAAALLLSSGGPGDARREDFAVWAQAISLTSAATAWGKVLFHRPRPVRYTDDAATPFRPDDGLSFPSGHASVAFAAAAAFASIRYQRRDARDQQAAAAVLLTTATATAALRVAARRHFPTDVVAGAVLGTAIGWILPAIYPMR